MCTDKRCVVALLLFSGFVQCAHAADPKVLRVEEDWRLVLGDPEPLLDSPQFSTWMSPTGSLDSEHFCVDFNHAQRPDFSSGGFQTKALVGDSIMEDSLSENGDNLSQYGETVTWTQMMAIHSGRLYFAVKDGNSTSWGTFGGASTVVKFQQTPVSDLGGYSPEKSASWAGVGFGGNRVESLQLLRVRYYLDNGSIVQQELNLNIE